MSDVFKSAFSVQVGARFWTVLETGNLQNAQEITYVHRFLSDPILDDLIYL
jgi:hypothetical protein